MQKGRDELLESKEANRLKVDVHIEELNWDIRESLDKISGERHRYGPDMKRSRCFCCTLQALCTVC